jgi:hypothetical protein
VNRCSASARVLADASACAAMAVNNCPNNMRRLEMSALVAAVAAGGEGGGERGGVPLMLSSERSGHDKSRSRQMRFTRSGLGPDDEEDLR